MWTWHSEKLIQPTGWRFFADREAMPASFAQVIDAWQHDEGFSAGFNTLLADVSFVAFRWETPAVTSATILRPFECVVLDCPNLARRSDPTAFEEHFAKAPEASVVEFANLGRDAILIVPRPQTALSAYGHLAAFVREAPESQRRTLWQLVGRAMERRVGPRPVWLSTAGAGVSWLHVRLDDRPKYYGFAPYRQSV